MSGNYQPWDFLSDKEAASAQSMIAQLSGVGWANQLLKEIKQNGGVTQKNKSRLFELRFGYALHKLGISPRYEVPGEGSSTLDFGFSYMGQDWLVELMRLEETRAVKEATQTYSDAQGGQFASLQLSTNADNPAHSPEGETIKAIERICQKCERGGKPHKFPIPNGAIHALLVDFRNFLDEPDEADFIQVGLGGETLRHEFRMQWQGRPVTGAFSKNTTLRGAVEARERIHLLGFICEKSYGAGDFALSTRFIANRDLLPTQNDIGLAKNSWPLKPVRILNEG